MVVQDTPLSDRSAPVREMRCFMVVRPNVVARLQAAHPKLVVGDLLQRILDQYPEHVARFRARYTHDTRAVEQWMWDADQQRYYFTAIFVPKTGRDADLIGDD